MEDDQGLDVNCPVLDVVDVTLNNFEQALRRGHVRMSSLQTGEKI